MIVWDLGKDCFDRKFDEEIKYQALQNLLGKHDGERLHVYINMMPKVDNLLKKGIQLKFHQHYQQYQNIKFNM